jgi:hypothetical protein
LVPEPIHYRITDVSGKTFCYALAKGPVAKQDLSKLVGRKVGLVGRIEPHLATKSALVQFTEVVELK